MWFKRRDNGSNSNAAGSARTLYRASDLNRAGSNNSHPVDHEAGFADDCERIASSFGLRRLQSKTQLFPVGQNDFVRTRLTHSVEVAHVAKRIAMHLNASTKELRANPIDLNLVHAAALCHDIGHPPFGHTGERTLNHCMRSWGGFEGNAQSLRLVTRLEHSASDVALGRRGRYGLNLTSRTIAAVLKYDQQVPSVIPQSEGPDRSDIKKGFFPEDRAIVDKVRADVLGTRMLHRRLFSLEAQIMDYADDIAYSTFDLEDSFRTRYLYPIDFISSEPSLLTIIATHVSRALGETFSAKDVSMILRMILAEIFAIVGGGEALTPGYRPTDFVEAAINLQTASRELASSASLRSAFTSHLVNRATSAISLLYDDDCPALSKVVMPRDTRVTIETLKAFVYFTVTQSPEIQVARFKARHIIQAIFDALTSSDGLRLLPRERRVSIEKLPTEQAQKRAVCDFIADMTDTYATEFYSRLMSTDGETIYKPI